MTDNEHTPEYPKDKYVDGVVLTFCALCGDLGGRFTQPTDSSVFLKKCGNYEFCLNYKEKETEQ